jgi:hypothetical protein
MISGKPTLECLELKWAAPSVDGGLDIVNYDILLIFEDSSTQFVSKNTESSCTFTDLWPGRRYRFKVRARNAIGNGPWSDHVAFKTKTIPPIKPQKPKVSCVSSTSIYLNWDNPKNNGAVITQYCLQMLCNDQAKSIATFIKGDGDSSSRVLPTTHFQFTTIYSGVKPYYEKVDLIPSTEYQFRVSAINCRGSSDWSDKTVVKTTKAPPSQPTDVSCDVGSTYVCLKWEKPSNNGSAMSSYNIDHNGLDVISTGASTNAHTVRKLNPGVQHTFRVQAVNHEGEGIFSMPVLCWTLPLPPNPPSCECIYASNNALKLKWIDATRHKSYQDVRDKGTRHYNSLVFTLEMQNDKRKFQVVYCGKNHVFKIGKLLFNHSYKFRICAENEGGKGKYSKIYTFKTKHNLPETHKKAPKVEDVTDTACKVVWKSIKNSNPLQKMLYEVEIVNCTVPNSAFINKTIVETHYDTQELESNTNYSVRVKGVLELHDGEKLYGKFSPPLQFTTNSSSCSNVLNLSANRISEVKNSTEPQLDTNQECGFAFEYRAFVRMIILMLLSVLLASTIDVKM